MKMFDDLINELIDKKLQERLPKAIDKTIGRTIGMREFAKKYCGNRSNAWIKEHILYEFHPDWVEDVSPGQGKAIIIHEHEAAMWMEQNWRLVLDRANKSA